MNSNELQTLQDHSILLQQNVMKVINPSQCTPTETIQLQTISLLTDLVKYISECNTSKTSTKINLQFNELQQSESSINTDFQKESRSVPSRHDKDEPISIDKINSENLININQYMSDLKQWTGKREAKMIFEGNDLTSQNFWKMVKDLKNLMIIVETSDDFLFGSYHSQLPSSQDEWIHEDINHFVFTLNNPHNIKPTHFLPIPTNEELLFVYGDNDKDNVVWVNYCYWICGDNIAYVWHHFPDWYLDTSSLGGDIFVGDVDWDNPNEIRKVYVMEWLD
ncbi:TLDc domain-containing protein [Entamoeba marina]